MDHPHTEIDLEKWMDRGIRIHVLLGPTLGIVPVTSGMCFLGTAELLELILKRLRRQFPVVDGPEEIVPGTIDEVLLNLGFKLSKLGSDPLPPTRLVFAAVSFFGFRCHDFEMMDRSDRVESRSD